MQVRKIKTLEAPDLIYEQKISPAASPKGVNAQKEAKYDALTPRAKASPQRQVSNKRGLQARYNGDLQL